MQTWASSVFKCVVCESSRRKEKQRKTPSRLINQHDIHSHTQVPKHQIVVFQFRVSLPGGSTWCQPGRETIWHLLKPPNHNGKFPHLRFGADQAEHDIKLRSVCCRWTELKEPFPQPFSASVLTLTLWYKLQLLQEPGPQRCMCLQVRLQQLRWYWMITDSVVETLQAAECLWSSDSSDYMLSLWSWQWEYSVEYSDYTVVQSVAFMRYSRKTVRCKELSRLFQMFFIF